MAKTKRATVVGSSPDASKKRCESLLALIDRRKARIVEDFYDIGLALREIVQKKLYGALGFASFDALVDARVGIGRSQARKLVAIAGSYDREEALSLGLERAYQLVRYTEATPEPDSPKVLLETGARIGKKKVAEASVRDLVAATRAVQARAKTRGSDPKVTSAARTARDLQARLRKQGARSATVKPVKTREGLLLEVRIAIPDADRLGS